MHLYTQSVLVPCFNLRCVRNQGFELSFVLHTVPSDSDWGEPGNLRHMFKCIAKLFTCWKTERLPSSAAHIRVNIWWWRSLVYEWIELKRSTVQEKWEWHVMGGIQAFILERPYQVRNDGTDWIYTAAVHCLYKGSTMSIPKFADDAYSLAHNSSAHIPCSQRVDLPWWVRGVLPIHRFFIYMTWLSNLVPIVSVWLTGDKMYSPCGETTSQLLHDDMTQ